MLNNGNWKKIARLLLKNNIGYNLSSMAVRKDFLLQHLDILTTISVYGIDSLISEIALVYGKGIFIDKNIRSSVRVHSRNSFKTLLRGDEKFLSELFTVRKFLPSKSKSVSTYMNLVFTSTYIITYCRHKDIKRYLLFSIMAKHVAYRLKLGYPPEAYILISASSRLINMKFYSQILELHHSRSIH